VLFAPSLIIIIFKIHKQVLQDMLIGGKEAGASGGINFSTREYSFFLRTSETAEMQCPQEISNRCGDRNGRKDVRIPSARRAQCPG
jgi:hypothetical protein